MAPPRLSLRTPDRRALDRLMARQREERCSYDEIGATRGHLPDGYRHLEVVRELRRGDEAFSRATGRLLRWGAHRGAGVRVHPEAAPVEVGTTVVLVAAVGPLRATVACRIVDRVEEAGHIGFSYGTLPHHVVEGEEAFRIERDAAGRVRLRIRAFLRPRPGWPRALEPGVLLGDRLLVHRYGAAMGR